MRLLRMREGERGPDNSLQFDGITKASRPSTLPKLLNGTSNFKKGPFEEVSIDIGSKNNCPKSNIPLLTFFYVVNLRQMQKDPQEDVLNYVEMNILA